MSSTRKGFGSGLAGVQHVAHGTITPLKKRVLVSKMHFGETKTKGGIILMDDDGKSEGIHPRWAEVYAVGSTQDDVQVGQWILISHGRWSRALTVVDDKGEEQEVRMIDENDILLVSDTEPTANRKQAGYINMGGAQQMTKLPGND